MSEDKRINLRDSEFDQNTYLGRVLHFSKLTDPRNLFLSSQELERSKEIVDAHQKGHSKFPFKLD